MTIDPDLARALGLCLKALRFRTVAADVAEETPFHSQLVLDTAMHDLKKVRNAFFNRPDAETGQAFIVGLEKTLADLPRHPLVWGMAGTLAMDCDLPDLGGFFLRRGLKIDPENKTLARHLAQALLTQKRYQASLDIIRPLARKSDARMHTLKIAAEAAFHLYEAQLAHGKGDHASHLSAADAYAKRLAERLPPNEVHPEVIMLRRRIEIAFLEADGSAQALNKVKRIRAKMNPVAPQDAPEPPG